MRRLMAQLFRTGELESLSEAEYERIRARADARAGDVPRLVAAGVAFGAFVLWLGGGYAIMFAVGKANAPPVGSVVPTTAPTFSLAADVNWLFAFLCAWVVYVLVSEWRLARTMRRVQNKAGCPNCEFSLVGLTPDLGAVLCPECGCQVVLSEHGIPPEALLTASSIPIPDAGPMAVLKGEIPKGRQRQIRRQYGGIPSRSSVAAKPVDGHGSDEVL